MTSTFGTPGLKVSDEGEGIFSRDVSLAASSTAENDLSELKKAVLEAKYSTLLSQVTTHITSRVVGYGRCPTVCMWCGGGQVWPKRCAVY